MDYNEIKTRPYELSQRRTKTKRDYFNAHSADCLGHRPTPTNSRLWGLTEDEWAEVGLYSLAFAVVLIFVYALSCAFVIWVRNGGCF